VFGCPPQEMHHGPVAMVSRLNKILLVLTGLHGLAQPAGLAPVVTDEPWAEFLDSEIGDECPTGGKCGLSLLQLRATRVVAEARASTGLMRSSPASDGAAKSNNTATLPAGSRANLGIRAKSKQEQQPLRLQQKARSVGSGGATYFAEAYGDGFAWFTGVIAQDSLFVAGAEAHGRFGLLQMGAGSIGNSYPASTGPSVDDGIMGLAPGCLDINCTQITDPVSSLVAAGAISRHVFTMCFNDGLEGGGMMYLGLPDASLLEGATVFPLRPLPKRMPSETYEFEVPISTHRLRPMSQDADITFYMGHEPIGFMSSLDFDLGQSFIDTGTGGFLVPEFLWSGICASVAQALYSDEMLRDIFGERSVKWTLGALMNGELALTLSSSQAQRVQAAVPDFRFSLPGIGEVSVSGSTLFFQTAPCSGVYWMSWRPNPGRTFAFGTAFLWGKTAVFDHSDTSAPSLMLVGTAAGCKRDYSERGHKMPMRATAGQALNPAVGAYTAEIAVGSPPQPLVVQLDTGSQDLLVYQKSCMALGLPGCVTESPCESCFYIIPVNGLKVVMALWSPFAGNSLSAADGGRHMSPACKNYISPLVEALNSTGTLRNMLLHNTWIIGNFTIQAFQEAAASILQPYAHCGASRAACGRLNVFDPRSSATFSIPSHSKGFSASASRAMGQLQDVSYVRSPPPFIDRSLMCDACG